MLSLTPTLEVAPGLLSLAFALSEPMFSPMSPILVVMHLHAGRAQNYKGILLPGA